MNKENNNVDKEKVLKAVKSLDGLNPTEWNMVNRAVNEVTFKNHPIWIWIYIGLIL